MSKVTKRIAALILAAAMMVTAAPSAFAGPSAEQGNEPTSLTIEVKKSKKAAVKSGAVMKEYDTVTLVLYQRNKVKKTVLKGAGKNSKTVVITKAKKAKKLLAKRFDSKAFKGYKGTIIVKKSAMTKSEYKKLKAKLKKGGFKGKISYKK